MGLSFTILMANKPKQKELATIFFGGYKEKSQNWRMGVKKKREKWVVNAFRDLSNGFQSVLFN